MDEELSPIGADEYRQKIFNFRPLLGILDAFFPSSQFQNVRISPHALCSNTYAVVPCSNTRSRLIQLFSIMNFNQKSMDRNDRDCFFIKQSK